MPPRNEIQKMLFLNGGFEVEFGEYFGYLEKKGQIRKSQPLYFISFPVNFCELYGMFLHSTGVISSAYYSFNNIFICGPNKQYIDSFNDNKYDFRSD